MHKGATKQKKSTVRSKTSLTAVPLESTSLGSTQVRCVFHPPLHVLPAAPDAVTTATRRLCLRSTASAPKWRPRGTPWPPTAPQRRCAPLEAAPVAASSGGSVRRCPACFSVVFCAKARLLERCGWWDEWAENPSVPARAVAGLSPRRHAALCVRRLLRPAFWSISGAFFQRKDVFRRVFGWQSMDAANSRVMRQCSCCRRAAVLPVPFLRLSVLRCIAHTRGCFRLLFQSHSHLTCARTHTIANVQSTALMCSKHSLSFFLCLLLFASALCVWVALCLRLLCVISCFVLPDTMGKNKPAGLRAARKLRNHRREQRWAQKSYKKSHSVSSMKADPLGGSTMAKGIVLEKMCVRLVVCFLGGGVWTAVSRIVDGDSSFVLRFFVCNVASVSGPFMSVHVCIFAVAGSLGRLFFLPVLLRLYTTLCFAVGLTPPFHPSLFFLAVALRLSSRTLPSASARVCS